MPWSIAEALKGFLRPAQADPTEASPELGSPSLDASPQQNLRLVLPVVTLHELWHVGRLDDVRTPSYEGHHLSASLVPSQWRSTTELDPSGRYTIWKLTHNAARFLDETALAEETRAFILDWALSREMLEPFECFEVTTRFSDGSVALEYLDTPEKSLYALNAVVDRKSRRISTHRITKTYAELSNRRMYRAWLAQWAVTVEFAASAGLDGALQRFRGHKGDLVYPMAAVFNKSQWTQTWSYSFPDENASNDFPPSVDQLIDIQQ